MGLSALNLLLTFLLVLKIQHSDYKNFKKYHGVTEETLTGTHTSTLHAAAERINASTQQSQGDGFLTAGRGERFRASAPGSSQWEEEEQEKQRHKMKTREPNGRKYDGK